jgi:outer membrane protein insertion porin family
MPTNRSWILLFAWTVLTIFASTAGAQESFVIRDIRVDGLQRISAGTVFNALPVKVGDVFSEDQSPEAVRALFKTGYFDDVSLEREGDVLIVKVSERPAVTEITIEGNKNIKTEDLLKGLKETGFAEGEVYNQSVLDRIHQELQRQYYAQGKYGVVITPTVTPLDGNRVKVDINIKEGDAARIKQINVVGNRAYSDKELLEDFELSTGTWLSFFTKDNQYSRQKLSGDLETLRSHYLDDGYINFNIDSTQVSITPDKKDVYITINISEGDRFAVSGVRLAGELVVSEDELFPLVKTPAGAIFSRKLVTETSENITNRLGDEGYAFANVNAIPDINDETRMVELTYFVDPGKRVYVRRINFTGNTKTRDEVLRREMRQMEGGWIATQKVERSKVRLQRLGYFEEVNVETPAVAGSADQVDVDYTVTERPSGNLLLGLGFSQSQGLIFNTTVTQDNFLGSGKRMSFAFNNSDVNRRFVVGYYNPYWTIDGVSRGFDISYQETDSDNANITSFDSTVASLGMNFGVPISEYNAIGFAVSYEYTELQPGFFSSQQVLNFINREGSEFKTLRLRSSFSYDTRNAALLPDRGLLHQIVGELATPGGDLNYYRLDYRTQWFIPLSKSWTLLLKGNLGYGGGYGDTDELPFFENFYAGGPRSVRGYKDNSLGPQDTVGNSLGGIFKVIGNAEIILPLPFLKQVKSVRLTGFIDAGNVFAKDENIESVAFAVRCAYH